MQSRIKAILACGLVILVFGSLLALYGYDATWKLWNIPTMSPHFADLRTITGGAESYAQGFDPMMFNPGDPWQRPLNYPRVWQSLYSMGIDQSHTTYLGITLVLLFFVGICLILPNASYAMIFLVMAAVLSPATLQYNLGMMYLGGQGVNKDYVRTLLWLNLAAVSGDVNAIRVGSSVTPLMTPQQITEVQTMARDCMANKFKGCY